MRHKLIMAIALGFSFLIVPLVRAQNEGFVGRSGNHFVLNGQPFYFAGANNYYQIVYAADPGLRPFVDEVQEEMAAMGMTALRTWAFNDGDSLNGEPNWNPLQPYPRVYNESVFQGLDYVLDKAHELGLRVTLALVNNWDDYGGMNQYASWSPTASQHDEFYTDDSCRIWYKNHIYTVLHRINTFNGRVYKEDSTIFAWELANEPRCESDISGNTLQAWIEEMSAYVKSLDSLHLVTTGSEGFYGISGPPHNPIGWFNNAGVDFIRNHQPATIDFAVFHLWPDSWSLNYSQTLNWITDHCQDSDSLLEKPVVLEEYGKFRPDSVRNQYFTGWLGQIYASASANGAAGGSNLWILYHDAYPDYDGFGVYFPNDSGTVSILENHAEQMNQLYSSVAPGRATVAPYRGPVLTVFPNPTNPQISISFNLESPQQATLAIFSVTGARVATLAIGLLPAGTSTYIWDGTNAASGIYIARLETEKSVSETRFNVVK